MDLRLTEMLDAVLADKDAPGDDGRRPWEHRIGLAVRAIPRLVALAASIVATTGTLLLLVHYAFVVHGLPTTDVPTLLKLAGVATFGTGLALIAVLLVGLPGYLSGHLVRSLPGQSRGARLPTRLALAIFGFAFAGDILATVVSPQDVVVRLHLAPATQASSLNEQLLLMIVPAYVPALALLANRAGRTVFQRHLPGLVVGPLAWVLLAFLFSVNLVSDVIARDPRYGDQLHARILFALTLLLSAVINAMVAAGTRARIVPALMLLVLGVMVIDPLLISEASFRIFHLSDYKAMVQFRDDKVAQFMHHRCDLRYTPRNKDGYLYIVDSSGPSIIYRCIRLGITRTGSLDPKDVFVTSLERDDAR